MKDDTPPESITVEVQIVKDARGRVSSSHDLSSDEDRSRVMAWPTGGLAQVAFALLTEATHREALLDIILKVSQDPEFGERVSRMSVEERDVEIGKLADAMVIGMSRTVQRLSVDAVRAALEHVAPRR